MHKLAHSRLLRVLIVLGLAGAAFGTWVLLHPASFVVQPWRAKETTVSSRFIFGPYPIEHDMERLEDAGVTTIISLLNPAVPYEKVLLEQEQKTAKQYGISVRNFPMGSILGQRFGDDYDSNSRAAAQTAIQSPGTVYIHCYLGLHRAKSVQHYLNQYAKTSEFTGTLQHGRDADTLAAERAAVALTRRDYATALAELDRIRQPSYGNLVERGWVLFRLNRHDEARRAFNAAIQMDRDALPAHNGLGFAALRLGDTSAADQAFTRVLAIDGDNGDGIEGMAYVRYRQGQRDEARALLERVVERAPGNNDARALLERLKRP